MQSGSNLTFFNLAEIIRNGRKRLIRQLVLPRDPGQPIVDLFLQLCGSARIKRDAVRMLFQQAFDFFQIIIQSGSGEWRRKMIDNDRRRTALSLDAFSWIINNERINQRYRTQTKPRIVFLSESDAP